MGGKRGERERGRGRTGQAEGSKSTASKPWSGTGWLSCYGLDASDEDEDGVVGFQLMSQPLFPSVVGNSQGWASVHWPLTPGLCCPALALSSRAPSSVCFVLLGLLQGASRWIESSARLCLATNQAGPAVQCCYCAGNPPKPTHHINTSPRPHHLPHLTRLVANAYPKQADSLKLDRAR